MPKPTVEPPKAVCSKGRLLLVLGLFVGSRPSRKQAW